MPLTCISGTNGLSSTAGELNLLERLLRLKGRWHGELAGRENEIHLQFCNSLTETSSEPRFIAKFLPLEYALGGTDTSNWVGVC